MKRVDQLGPSDKDQEFKVEVFKGVFRYGAYAYKDPSGYWFKYTAHPGNAGQTGLFSVVSGGTIVVPTPSAPSTFVSPMLAVPFVSPSPTPTPFIPSPVVLTPSSSAPGRVQGDIHQTNDLVTPYGCFACVAADYKGVKLSTLLGQKGMVAKDDQLAFIAKTKNVVDGANLIKTLGYFGIKTSIHQAEIITDFDAWAATAAAECGPTEAYDGALG
jgi:hypothetical protein